MEKKKKSSRLKIKKHLKIMKVVMNSFSRGEETRNRKSFTLNLGVVVVFLVAPQSGEQWLAPQEAA